MRFIFSFSVLLIAIAPLKADPPTSTTGPWDLKALQSVEVKPTWGGTAAKVREVYYPGEPLKGNQTRVFAYYALPEGAGPFPAMLLVHGGGGRLFPNGRNTGQHAGVVPWRWIWPAMFPKAGFPMAVLTRPTRSSSRTSTTIR